MAFSRFQAWLNEKFAPELLELKGDIVDCMLEQINQMEENIQRAKKHDFKITIHKMEASEFLKKNANLFQTLRMC